MPEMSIMRSTKTMLNTAIFQTRLDQLREESQCGHQSSTALNIRVIDEAKVTNSRDMLVVGT
jgi:hypothetical protein